MPEWISNSISTVTSLFPLLSVFLAAIFFTSPAKKMSEFPNGNLIGSEIWNGAELTDSIEWGRYEYESRLYSQLKDRPSRRWILSLAAATAVIACTALYYRSFTETFDDSENNDHSGPLGSPMNIWDFLFMIIGLAVISFGTTGLLLYTRDRWIKSETDRLKRYSGIAIETYCPNSPNPTQYKFRSDLNGHSASYIEQKVNNAALMKTGLILDKNHIFSTLFKGLYFVFIGSVAPSLFLLSCMLFSENQGSSFAGDPFVWTVIVFSILSPAVALAWLIHCIWTALNLSSDAFLIRNIVSTAAKEVGSLDDTEINKQEVLQK